MTDIDALRTELDELRFELGVVLNNQRAIEDSWRTYLTKAPLGEFAARREALIVLESREG